MNKNEKRAQVFLYFGILLTLIALDWRWYEAHYPEASFLLALPFAGILYGVWIAAIAVCFGLSAVCFWKSRSQQQIHRRRHRK